MGEIYTGVVDRFEGDQVVVLLESDGDVVDERLVSTDKLPEAGRHDDAVIQVSLEDGEIADIEYDEDETESRKERAQSRFQNLSERPPSSDNDSS
jgi:hypothetical protein